MSNPTSSWQEAIDQALTDLYYAQSRLEGTGTDPGTSRGAQIRKTKAAINAAALQYIAGEDVELRDPSDHLANAYQYLKGKNELRANQRVVIKGESNRDKEVI